MTTYQVLARKWRPQRFDDVIGQRGVTQTLANAIGADRIAQAFVFSGPRGVGKTTTARILARALNCLKGPTAEPCGTCDACVEIAQGRDMDVLEIDAASNTGIQDVRDVIIDGLAIAPVRDRYKVFIIDEVHRLSQQAFDGLLKSIEEPPPHVVFMMATTELEKVPSTIQSRSQVFELKTIGLKQIAEQLRAIASEEKLQLDDAAVSLVARAADGSMRDALSALDQVIAFAGTTITAEDVTKVLGLVHRDLLLDIADAVKREDGAAAFELANRAVESGNDLRQVIRELARVTRDLLVLRVDPSRASDPEIAAEGERTRLQELAGEFSDEDLMRAFDLLSRAESDIKNSTQPRYHLEMVLLRWIHLRRLQPLADIIQGLEKGTGPSTAASAKPPVRPPTTSAATVRAVETKRVETTKDDAKSEDAPKAVSRSAARPDTPAVGSEFKNAFLAEVNKAKRFFHGTVIAQAQRIDCEAERIVLTFAPQHRALRQQLDQNRPWLEELASRLSGRKTAVVGIEGSGPAPSNPGQAAATGAASADSEAARQAALKQKAMADSGVQAMLDVFGTDIKEVEEM